MGQGFCSMHWENISEWIWFCFNTLKDEELTQFCYAVRSIWFNRNKCLHEGRGISVNENCLSIKVLAASHLRPSFSFTISDLDGKSAWTAPQKSFLKWNCDGSWEKESKFAGFSGVCRDDEGIIVGIMADFQAGVESILEAECLAILRSMRWALMQDLTHCIFETDCSEAFALLTLRSHSSRPYPVAAHEIITLLLSRSYWSLALVRREANCIADKLAKLARVKAWSWSLAEALPRLPGLLP